MKFREGFGAESKPPGVIEEKLQEFKEKEKTESGFPKGWLDWYDEKFTLRGKTVENIGVYHHVSALVEYGKELQDAIRRASIIVLEGAPTAGGMFSEAYVDQQIESARRKGKALSRDTIRGDLNFGMRPGIYFFRIIEEIAAREGKPVAVVDPAFSDFNELGDEDRRKKMMAMSDISDGDWTKIKREIGIAAGGIGAILAAELLSRIVSKKAAESEKKARSEDKMTRRTFLTRGVQGAGAVAIGSQVFAGTIRDKGGPYAMTPFGNFRDVISAKGLQMLAEKNFGDGPILLIYATPHSRGIQRYCLNPEEATKKYDSYKYFRDVRHPTLRIYQFERGEWRAKEKNPI